jgi:hypothetical protein
VLLKLLEDSPRERIPRELVRMIRAGLRYEDLLSDGWRLPTRAAAPVGSVQAARPALISALDNWDRDAADAAIVNYAHAARPDEICSLLFPYGARDLRAIGHKAITVSNAHCLIELLGSAQAELILR